MKKILLLICLPALAATALKAQPLNRSTPEAMLKEAQRVEAEGNLYGALDAYEDVYSETKDKTLSVKIAELQFKLRDYEKAERTYSRLVLRDRKSQYTELKYWYALTLKANGKFQEAIDNFNEYINEGIDEKLKAASKVEIAGCEMARKSKAPENLIINNAGKKVNQPQTEASPFYSGGELYYAQLAGKDVISPDGEKDDWYAKIVTTTKNGQEFADPAPLGEQINREGYHQGNVSITPDGRTMYFTRVQLSSNALQESKIFYSSKGSDGWGAANEVGGVNGEFLAKHPCEGELFGEKVLFFVSNMPGGKGGDDIYYAAKKGDGSFGLPVNLGDVINTPGDDVTPFYKDGKMYFSSNGHESFGGLDVFESQWNGSVWSKPRNMGGGINSTLDDQYFTMSNDGQSGYLVSNRPGPNNLKSKTCCDDIYTWEFERIKVNLIAKTYRTKKANEKEAPGLKGCTVEVFDVTDKNPANVDNKTNPANNDFTFELAPEKSYMVIATRADYFSDTVTFNTVGVKKTRDVEKKLFLKPVPPKEPDSIVITTNEPIRLNAIYYDYDKWDILPDAEKDLQFLYDLMTKYKDMKIELSSHTDSRGRDEYNEQLSQKRAESAKDWLVKRGIVTDRIVAKGYGETQILNECANGVECDEEKHRFNRRTEFKIIAGPTSITIERKEKRPATTPTPKKN